MIEMTNCHICISPIRPRHSGNQSSSINEHLKLLVNRRSL